MDKLANGERLVTLVPVARKVHVALQVQLEKMERPVLQDHVDHQDPQVYLEQLVLPVLVELLERPEFADQQDNKESKDPLEQPDPSVH